MPSQFTKTFTTFSGADIVCTFDGTVIGEIQAISVTVTREKTFVYTMGSPDPRSITRGKRAIGGSLVFVVFDREALVSTLKTTKGGKNNAFFRGPAPAFEGENALGNATRNTDGTAFSSDTFKTSTQEAARMNFADQILPFDIVVTYANEYGNKARLVLYGVEILSDGMGVSVDDLVVERQYSYIALSMKNLENIGTQGSSDSLF